MTLPESIRIKLSKREYIGLPQSAVGEYLLVKVSDEFAECPSYAVSKWSNRARDWEQVFHPETPSELFNAFRTATEYDGDCLRLR